MNEDKNTYLHKWLNDELSTEELNEFKKTDVYKENVHLVKSFDGAKIPDYEMDIEYSKIVDAKNERINNKGKLIQLRTHWMKIAAAIILFLSIGYFTYESFTGGISEYNTTVGEFASIELPDQSNVRVNAKSMLSFDVKNWNENRMVNLNGEAYFEVAKGKTFTVNTPQGLVKVLGTKFNVKQRNTIFEVVCYEGRVQVSYLDENYILTKGDVFYSLKNNTKLLKRGAVNSIPSWTENRSYFNAVPINLVFEDIQLHYEVSIQFSEDLNQSKNFTGGYYYNDSLENTLKAVCSSLNLSYTIEGKNIYIK